MAFAFTFFVAKNPRFADMNNISCLGLVIEDVSSIGPVQSRNGVDTGTKLFFPSKVKCPRSVDLEDSIKQITSDMNAYETVIHNLLRQRCQSRLHGQLPLARGHGLRLRHAGSDGG